MRKGTKEQECLPALYVWNLLNISLHAEIFWELMQCQEVLGVSLSILSFIKGSHPSVFKEFLKTAENHSVKKCH